MSIRISGSDPQEEGSRPHLLTFDCVLKLSANLFYLAPIALTKLWSLRTHLPKDIIQKSQNRLSGPMFRR